MEPLEGQHEHRVELVEDCTEGFSSCGDRILSYRCSVHSSDTLWWIVLQTRKLSTISSLEGYDFETLGRWSTSEPESTRVPIRSSTSEDLLVD